jgi:alkylglycerol monooxygenase
MGWFEYVFNTPSHHRVHHGRDPKYIDKNHAGSLIIWDKMFGTFQAEEEKPTYGITKPLNSWNAIFANVSHYVEMGKDLRQIPSWTDRLRYLFKKPGWLPDSLGGYRPPPPVDKRSYKKYDTPAPMALNLYVLFQYILCLVATALFLNHADQFSLSEKGSITLMICVVVVNSGVLFERRVWAIYSEWARIIFYPLLLAALTYVNGWTISLYILAGVYFLVSSTWFYAVQKKNVVVQMA